MDLVGCKPLVSGPEEVAQKRVPSASAAALPSIGKRFPDIQAVIDGANAERCRIVDWLSWLSVIQDQLVSHPDKKRRLLGHTV